MSVKVVDKLPQFTVRMHNTMNDAIREATRDILITSRNRAPFQKGQLRANSEATQIGFLKHRVSYWKEYARYQEFGGDGKRIIRNYTTSGTGRGFLKTSGDQVASKLVYTLKKHAGRIR